MSHRERKLTPAEQKRKAAFEALCAQMARAGYRQKDFVIGILQANTLSFLIMLPFLALAAWIYSPFIAAGGSFFPGAQFFLLFLAIVGLLVVHECIHGLPWGLFAPRHFASISFGVIWKALTPYCTCSAPLRRWQYALGTAMPTLVLGAGLTMAAAALHQNWLFLLVEIMILGGGGDFLILLRLFRYRPSSPDVLCLDHPYECGFVAFEKAA